MSAASTFTITPPEASDAREQGEVIQQFVRGGFVKEARSVQGVRGGSSGCPPGVRSDSP